LVDDEHGQALLTDTKQILTILKALVALTALIKPE